MLILRQKDIRTLTAGLEEAIIEIVRGTYILHSRGRTVVPPSVFLNLPGGRGNRIIGMPAYLEDGRPAAGIKWISSFPANIAEGMSRASAVIVLSNAQTGRVEAFLDGTLISAARTAASAALAVRLLYPTSPSAGLSLIGCGPINFEILRYLLLGRGDAGRLGLFDSRRARAKEFALRAKEHWPTLDIEIFPDADSALRAHELISVATNALTPHLDARMARAGSLLLHISLRDILPESILHCQNVVDDIEHVCRAGTSLDLAAQLVGTRSFIESTIGDLLAGTSEPPSQNAVTVFSPFGLGILDLAVATRVRDHAVEVGLGTNVTEFQE